ncbi:hypothetical protein DYB32_009802, partial [Aphanomyces invadans]
RSGLTASVCVLVNSDDMIASGDLKSNDELDEYNIGFLDFQIALYKKRRERKEKAKREAKEKTFHPRVE